MSQQTVTAFFDTKAEAEQAVNELVKAGIARDGIKVMPEAEADAATSTTFRAAPDDKSFLSSLRDVFLPEDDHRTFVQALQSGRSLVAVTVAQAEAGAVEDILEEHGTVNLVEREASYGGEAEKPSVAGVPGAAASTGAVPQDTGKDDVLSVVEEQINVGKRQVSEGRVKVRSHVVEAPVSEQVSLRTESVHVTRRPVDRAARDDEDYLDRTLEAQASSEQAVASKKARVTGEVRLTRDSTERTETVSDTVRRTEVEIEDERASGPAGTIAANGSGKFRR